MSVIVFQFNNVNNQITIESGPKVVMTEQAFKALKWCSPQCDFICFGIILKINKNPSFALASVKHKWPSELFPDEWIPNGNDNYSTVID